ncbi:MAG: 4-(cytidine 5'-diphospho)-2-C-methyl-D-erythritol kinase [Candidatus Cloacimonetes bacterium]|nr:4-(cytidine 5'-diphospho)-2-C-methyl-D-erythritol kinase [Candidatus Cloacimonadota bacterium]
MEGICEQYWIENRMIIEKNHFLLKSYAKINLYLDVLHRLDSGYHSLLTLFSEINLNDILKFSLTKNLEIKILSTSRKLANQNNLIYKVGIFIQKRYSVGSGAIIELEKNIPISSGLGGGSSNAASTIIGLSRLWGLNLSQSEMHEIAAEFGSDINFFLEGYQAIGRNRGEQIEPIQEEIEFENILLVNPKFGISSKEAYELLEDGEDPSLHPLTKGVEGLEKLLEKKRAEYCFNRLEAGIRQKYPIIEETIELLEKNGAKKAMLSGSGPTMIGFFESPETMKEAQKIVKSMNFWSYTTTTRRRPKK